jgi:hypothetical protein
MEDPKKDDPKKEDPKKEDPKKEEPKNDFMYDYLLRFKDGGMILKPNDLIYIPKPPPQVTKPNPKVDYKQVSYKAYNGFQTTTL